MDGGVATSLSLDDDNDDGGNGSHISDKDGGQLNGENGVSSGSET